MNTRQRFPTPTSWFSKKGRREAAEGYAFVFPTYLGYIAFVIGPIFAAIGLSFFKYDLLSSPQFIGLDNYAYMLDDPRLQQVFLNTLLFSIGAVTLNLGVGLLLAVLLNRYTPPLLKYLFRTAFFFPVLVSLAYCAVIWQFLYQKDTGVVNYYLGLFGIAPVSWLNSREWVIPAVVIVDVWKNAGFAMLVFLAGLQNIPEEYVEAAQIDGANQWQIYKNIIIPLLTPTIFFNLIIFMIGTLKAFDSIFVLTRGGPGDASRTLVLYIYEQAFQNFRMGYASAIAMILFIIILGLTLLQFRLSRRWVHYT
jgi:multiple sugar transport system permease protein